MRHLISLLVVFMLISIASAINISPQNNSYTVNPETLVFLLAPNNRTNNLQRGEYFVVEQSFSSQDYIYVSTVKSMFAPPPTPSLQAVGSYAQTGSGLAVSIDSYSLSPRDAKCYEQYTDYSTNLTYYRCQSSADGNIRYRAYPIGMPSPGRWEIPANIRVVGVLTADGSSGSGEFRIPNPQVNVLVININVSDLRASGRYIVDKQDNMYTVSSREYRAVVDILSQGYGSTSIWVRVTFYAYNGTSNATASGQDWVTKVQSLVDTAVDNPDLVNLGSFESSFSIRDAQSLKWTITFQGDRAYSRIAYVAEAGIDGGGSITWVGAFNIDTRALVVSVGTPHGVMTSTGATVIMPFAVTATQGVSYSLEAEAIFNTDPKIPGIDGSKCSVYISSPQSIGDCRLSVGWTSKPPDRSTISASYSGRVRLEGFEFQISGSSSGNASSVKNYMLTGLGLGRYLYATLLAPVIVIAFGAILYGLSYFTDLGAGVERLGFEAKSTIMSGIALLVILYALPMVTYNIVASILTNAGSSLVGGFYVPTINGLTPLSYETVILQYQEAIDTANKFLDRMNMEIRDFTFSLVALGAALLALLAVPVLISALGLAISMIIGPLIGGLVVAFAGAVITGYILYIGIGALVAIAVIAIAVIVIGVVIGTALAVFPATSGLGFNFLGGAAAAMIIFTAGAPLAKFMARLVEDAVLTYVPGANLDILSSILNVIPISGQITLVINAIADVTAASLIIFFTSSIIIASIAAIPILGGMISSIAAAITRLGR